MLEDINGFVKERYLNDVFRQGGYFGAMSDVSE